MWHLSTLTGRGRGRVTPYFSAQALSQPSEVGPDLVAHAENLEPAGGATQCADPELRDNLIASGTVTENGTIENKERTC